jgi:hypothetical protein
MPSTLKTLTDKGLIQPPKWLPDNVHYETMMGSVAYGVSGDTSDVDIYGFAIPPKEMVFPHLAGEIEGFSTKGQMPMPLAEKASPMTLHCLTSSSISDC